MIDQATELRKLSFNHTYHAIEKARAAQLLVISGGKGGVGTTTIAVNLAVALAAKQHKVLLIETAPHRTDIATLCGLTEKHELNTNSTRQKDLSRLLQRGPAGLMILPATWVNSDQPSAQSISQSHRLPQHLVKFQSDYDLLIVDVGNQTTSLSYRLRAAADELVMVTTCDPISVMDSFTLLKTKPRRLYRPHVQTVVNWAKSPQQATNVHQRISHACRRFLGFNSKPLGSIPEEPLIRTAASQATPFVTHKPETQAATTLTAMAQQLYQGCYREH